MLRLFLWEKPMSRGAVWTGKLSCFPRKSAPGCSFRLRHGSLFGWNFEQVYSFLRCFHLPEAGSTHQFVVPGGFHNSPSSLILEIAQHRQGGHLSAFLKPVIDPPDRVGASSTNLNFSWEKFA